MEANILADQILNDIASSRDVNTTDLFSKNYYSKTSYSFYSEVITYLIEEKLIVFDQDMEHANITSEGMNFIKSGGHEEQFQQEYIKYLKVNENSDPELKLEDYEVDLELPIDRVYVRRQQTIIERNKNKFLVALLAFSSLILIRVVFYNLKDQNDTSKIDMANIQKVFDSATSYKNSQHARDSIR